VISNLIEGTKILTIVIVHEVVVEDVALTETEGGSPGVEVLPVVASVGDPDGSILMYMCEKSTERGRRINLPQRSCYQSVRRGNPCSDRGGR